MGSVFITTDWNLSDNAHSETANQSSFPRAWEAGTRLANGITQTFLFCEEQTKLETTADRLHVLIRLPPTFPGLIAAANSLPTPVQL